MAGGYSLEPYFQLGSGIVNERSLRDVFKNSTGYKFKDVGLLTRALTHSSQTPGSNDHNERLEFLGDRVLALVIAEDLHNRFPKAQEGDMALRLNTMVRKETCAQVADNLKLGQMMQNFAGKKIVAHDIFNSRNVLGDACEAVIAAVYIDGGFEAARKLVLNSWAPMLARKSRVKKDPKSALQEWALAQQLPVPKYTVVSREGPDHAPAFVISVEVPGNVKETGKGNSKRAAEQDAAETFLKSRKITY